MESDKAIDAIVNLIRVDNLCNIVNETNFKDH